MASVSVAGSPRYTTGALSTLLIVLIPAVIAAAMIAAALRPDSTRRWRRAGLL